MAGDLQGGALLPELREVISSEAGVQQGDPPGPLLSALLLQPVTQQLQEVEGLNLNAWYLENRTLVRSREALQES